MPLPALYVVEAIHCGTPLFQASTWPAVPMPKIDEVAMAVGAAEAEVPLAIKVPAAWLASWVKARVPLIVPSVDVAAEYTRPLLSSARPPTARLVMWRLVVVAFVVEPAEATKSI